MIARNYQKKHLCLICGNQVSDGSWYSGKKRCFNCYKKICKEIPNSGRFQKGMISNKKGITTAIRILNCIKCNGKLSNSSSYTSKEGICRKCIDKSKFNPNRTDFDRWERKKFRNTIKKEVLIRDGYKCQMCGNTNKLQVDHIQPWSEYVELRFDIKNCRTLCQKCHYLITFNHQMPKTIKNWGQYETVSN